MATANAMFTITDVGDLNGRNLLQRSFFTKDPWTGPTHNAVGDGFGIYHGKECLPVTAHYLYNNTNKGADSIFPDLTFEEGVQYTISGNWAQFRTDNKYNGMYLCIRHTDGTNTKIFQPLQNNVWSPFKCTSAIGKTVSKITCNYNATGITYIENFKLEVGTEATDWTPAPEDVSTALDDAKEAQSTADNARTAASNAQATADDALDEAVRKNSVYYQATAPTGNLKDGDTWFDTSNHYKISRWNVAEQNWIAAPLGDQAIGNLNASHINTGTLTAVDIEAGKAQDIAGTIKVYDENDAVKVGLDKDGLVATKGKIGGWNITSNSIEYDDGTAPTDSTVITDPDTGEELIEEGQSGLVGGRTILKLCTYDSSYPDAGPQLISATYNSSNVAEDSTLRISSGGLSCDYNRNNGVTGGSLSLSPKLINVINADYDEDQVLWTDSANLNPGSLTILMSKKENGEQTAMGRSFLTHGDLSFIGDDDNPQLASGIAHWSILSPERTVKDTLKVTVYHCGNLFWAHFAGTIPAGWAASNTQNVFVPIITGDTGLSNSAFAAPPDNLTKYIIPTNLTNMRISVTVRSDGQLGISRIAEPFKGNATTTIAGYMETCDIFWAHIG